MHGIQSKIKELLKRIFYRMNPNYRNILRMNERLDRIEGMIHMAGQNRNEAAPDNSGQQMLEKLFLAAEPIAYRYLYLLRYIRENDSVLDLECGYGAGAELLTKYTAVDSCLCLNSMDYYTRLGQMYHGSDEITYQTGCYADAEQKYNIIICFQDRKNVLLQKEDIRALCLLLEYDGILAVSFDESCAMAEKLLRHAQDYGLMLEQCFYQNDGSPELTDEKTGHAYRVIYLRKNRT